MKYKLLKDYECPTGTIRKGVVKTEEAWKGYFPFLCDGDCAIKNDIWFEFNTNHALLTDGFTTMGRKIKYVHQLQNLYQSLTGEELTIKE